MRKKAFTLIEVAITIFLVAVLGGIGYYYLNSVFLKKTNYKSTLQSQFNLIESMVFQCKSLSEQMPNQIGGADAADTNLSALECNTSIPYRFNGGKNGFVPIPPSGFGPYTATESGTAFYIAITADTNSSQDEALKELVLNYTSQQAELTHGATKATFKFYLSR